MSKDFHDQIAALAAPTCTQTPSSPCAGPFERTRGEARPGEVDVTVRCHECQACAHYVLDAESGQALDPAALRAKRLGEASA